jgi:hypothetical protein
MFETALQEKRTGMLWVLSLPSLRLPRCSAPDTCLSTNPVGVVPGIDCDR